MPWTPSSDQVHSSSMLQVHLLRVGPSTDSTLMNDSLDSLDSVLPLVDEASQKHIRGFRFLQDGRRCLSGRLLARYVAATRLGQPWPLSFGESERGRPYLVQNPSPPVLDFNTSHDADLVAVASLLSPTSPACRVGVDTMHMSNPWDDASIAELLEGLADQLTPQERAALAALPTDHARVRHLLALWTLKEAYVKATGEGLHAELRSVDYRIDIAQAQDARIGEARLNERRMDGWRFWLVEIDAHKGEDAYWLAVAEQADGAGGEVELRVTRPDWIEEVDMARIEAVARKAS